nr:MAG TPA: portal protein [Bacteriophage sp.]
MTMQNDITHYQPCESYDDFHGVMTYTFGELLNVPGGVDWTNVAWSWRDVAYDDMQYARCCKKIENRFYDRELGVMPVSRWKRHFLRLINEIMPTLKPLYAAADGNSGVMLSDMDTWHKMRTVFSDFPATQLAENQDYASNATDNQYETITNGDFMDKVSRVRSGDYVDIDVLLLEHLETCFSPLWTININNY